MKHTHTNITTTNITTTLIRFLGCVAIALATPQSAHAQLATHPALDASIPENMRNIALGDWGESVTDHLMRASGYETVSPKVGAQGLDSLAFKLDAQGRMIDVRAIEVKVRSGAGDFGLPGNSKDGLQLTPNKLAADLRRAALEHADPNVRRIATEASAMYAKDPASIKLQRHVLTIGDGKYTVYEGATTARYVGRPMQEASLDRVCETLAQSSDEQIAGAARSNLKYLKDARLGIASAPPVATGTTRPVPSTSAVRAFPKTTSGVSRASSIVARRISVVGGAAMAGVLTAGTVAAFSTYQWSQGEISDARMYEDLTRAGALGMTAATTTGAILIFTPAAPGVVLIAAGAATVFAAEAALDWAMERENEQLIPRERELSYGATAGDFDRDPLGPPPVLADPLGDTLRALRESRDSSRTW